MDTTNLYDSKGGMMFSSQTSSLATDTTTPVDPLPPSSISSLYTTNNINTPPTTTPTQFSYINPTNIALGTVI